MLNRPIRTSRGHESLPGVFAVSAYTEEPRIRIIQEAIDTLTYNALVKESIKR